MLAYELITSLLPVSVLLVNLLAVELVLFQKMDTCLLVKIDQMIFNVHDVLVLTILKTSHVHHASDLDLQILDIVTNICFNLSSALVVELIVNFLINTHNTAFEINTLLDEETQSIISLLHLFSILLSALLQLLLALKISAITLLHILIYSFQPFLVLSHTLRQIFLNLLFLLEHSIIIDLLHLFPL